MQRILVTGVHLPESGPAPPAGQRPSLALGMVMAYARKILGNDPAFDVEPRFITSFEEGEQLVRTPGTHVLLFSNYIWSYPANLAFSRRAKEINPSVITVHGGAHVPAYPGTCEEFLRAEAHVDFAIRGEGETSLVDLLRAIAKGEERREVVPNVSTIADGKFVQHPLRERTRDLEEFPSPYLTGVFDVLDPSTFVSVTLESNRGCPYGCTFCDWGAAILQKIRTFSLERTRAELEWIARHRVPAMWIADANFGILPRDVEVAKLICETKKKYGFPRRLTTNYAKNTHQHLIEIIEIFMEAGLISTGIVSIQTRDDRTLDIVRRKNIKTREYDKLRVEFQKRGFPLAVQLMIGLPGSNVDAYKGDLSHYFDHAMEVQIFRTILLPNSPMADPEYRAAHAIVYREDGLVTRTSTMSEDDFAIATLIARAYNAIHHFGILRYPLVKLRWEHNVDPLDVMHALALEEPELPSLLGGMLDANGNSLDLTNTHAPMMERLRLEGWRDLGEEFFAWAQAKYGLERDSSWDAVLDAQCAIMPDARRTFPNRVALPHDVARWYEDLHRGKPRALASYGPSDLAVEDPLGFSSRPYVLKRATRLQWELASPLARARSGNLGSKKVNPDLDLRDLDLALPWAVVSSDATAL